MDIPFVVRRLEAGDIEPMLEICRGNELFYRYHPPLATRENLLQDLTALPPGRSMRDKFFVGFFDGDALIAMMDWVLGYPKADTVWIGFFITTRMTVLLLGLVSIKLSTQMLLWRH